MRERGSPLPYQKGWKPKSSILLLYIIVDPYSSGFQIFRPILNKVKVRGFWRQNAVVEMRRVVIAQSKLLPQECVVPSSIPKHSGCVEPHGRGPQVAGVVVKRPKLEKAPDRFSLELSVETGQVTAPTTHRRSQIYVFSTREDPERYPRHPIVKHDKSR